MVPTCIVLLADHPGRRRALSRRLRARNFRVEAVPWDPDALSDKLRAWAADVVIWVQGPNDGLETIAPIRAASTGLPLLALVSEASAAVAHEATGLGADHVLAPSARTADIVLAIHQTLARSGRDFKERPQGAPRTIDEQLRVILDAAPIPLLVSRVSDGEVLYANEREAALIGLPRDKLIGQRTVDFYGDPEERPKVMERLLHERRLDDLEVRFRRANGELAWGAFALVVTELHGEPVVVTGCYDVTERKLAEDSLEKERNFVSAVLDTAGALVVVLDREGRVVRFNRACERITGYSFEEVRGKPFPETFLLPEERAEVEQYFAGILTGQFRMEHRNYWVTRTGEARLIEWANTTLAGQDGQIEYVVATGIDITERYQARQKLKLYRQIYDRSHDGIVVLDADGRFVERNPIHRLLSGYGDEDLIGRPAGEFFGEEMVATAIRTIRETGSFRGELVAPRADGTEIPIEVSAFSILNDAGEVLYYVAIGRDISKRKRAEEELRRAHDELERRVLERTAELARLNEKLQRQIVERKDAEDALRRSHELLSRQNAVLAEFSKRLSPERGNLENLLGDLNQAASSTLSVARVSVWLYGEDSTYIECLDLYDADCDRHERGQRLEKVNFPSYFRALGEHRSIAAHDAHADPRTREFSASYLTPLGISSMLDAPIWLEGNMVGVVCHEHVGPPRVWTPEEERFAASVADFASLTLETQERFRAEEALQQAHDELESRVEQRTNQLARMNFAYREELNERRQAQDALSRRLRYEEGLADCSKTLLTESGSEVALPQALRHLLQASEASLIYLCENFEDEASGLSLRSVYEIGPDRIDYSSGLSTPAKLCYADLPRWHRELSAGNVVTGVMSSLPEDERAFLSNLDVRSILALPLFVDGAWYGVLGFLDLEQERVWSKEDIRSLETGAEMVGVYLGRKRAADALRLSEERFRSLVENANDIIFSTTPTGTVTYVSPKFTEATGYDTEDLLGKTIDHLMNAEDAARARAWLAGLGHQERFSGFEHRLLHKNGEWRWWVANASVLRDENRHPREIIGVSRDISRMKQVVEDLARTNRELRDTQAQLVQSEKMASLGMLVAGIAHEINTPVGAIRSMHDTQVRALQKLESILLRDQTEMPGSTAAIQSVLDMVRDTNRVIESGSDRVTEIVRRLRSFARLDEAEMKEVDLHEGLEDTLLLIHHELKHNIEVRREYGDLPPVECTPGRLNQVFLNLLNNARQAIKGKGEITIRTFARDDRVHVAIGDNGSGIRPEHLDKIFDPGFTTKGVGVGTGLGLSICYQIVKDHRGEIRVESEPGRGTTFTVVLPLRRSDGTSRSGTGLELETL